MTSELSCPVCAYTEISGNSCPNCDTDLSLIRLLTDLPPSHPQVTQPKVAGWQMGVALLILMIGIGLVAMGSFLFLQPSQLITNTVNSPSPVANKADETPSLAQEPVNRQQLPSQPPQYTVKPGDHLTAITEQFCGKEKSWQVMVQANPQLKPHPDFLKVGEVLKVPNCEG